MKLTRFEKMLAAILFCGGTMFAYGFAQPPEGQRVRVVYEVPGEGTETQEGRYRPSKGRTDEVNLKEELPADEVLTVNVRGTDSEKRDIVEVTLGPSEQSQLENEIRGLVKKHAKADKEEQKALHAEIESKVGSLFDRRVTTQTNKIAELQAHIKKIQDQLERRKQLRKQIVERRVADLLGEPDELDWDEPIGPVSHLLPMLDFREESLGDTRGSTFATTKLSVAIYFAINKDPTRPTPKNYRKT